MGDQGLARARVPPGLIASQGRDTNCPGFAGGLSATADVAAECETWHSTCRTVSDQIETDGLPQGPSAGRAALKPGAFGAPLRGCGA